MGWEDAVGHGKRARVSSRDRQSGAGMLSNVGAESREASASTAQFGDGWVLVMDRLPKEGVPVQVFGKIPYGRTMRVLVAYRTYDWEQEDYGYPFWNGLPDHWDSRGLCGIREVSVWKPLSPPPNVGDDRQTAYVAKQPPDAVCPRRSTS